MYHFGEGTTIFKKMLSGIVYHSNVTIVDGPFIQPFVYGGFNNVLVEIVSSKYFNNKKHYKEKKEFVLNYYMGEIIGDQIIWSGNNLSLSSDYRLNRFDKKIITKKVKEFDSKGKIRHWGDKDLTQNEINVKNILL